MAAKSLKFFVPQEDQAGFTALVREVWGSEPSVATASSKAAAEHTKAPAIDWEFMIMVALVMPTAIQNTLTLMERAKLGEKLQAVVGWIHGRRKEKPKYNIRLTLPNGRTIILPDTPLEDVLDVWESGEMP